MAWSPHTTATASGAAVAWVVNSPASVAAGTGAVVSFQSVRICRRSAGSSSSIWLIRRLGSAADWSRTRASRAAIVSAVCWSNRSLAYSMPPISPAGGPPGPRRSARGTDRSNRALSLGLAGGGGGGGGGVPGRGGGGGGGVLEGHHDLEQRVAGQGPVRGQGFYQPLKR